MKLLVLFLTAAPSLVLGGYFSESCSTYFFTVDNGRALLEGQCNDASHNRQTTYVDVNYCIANIGDGLNWQHNGSFLASCTNCGTDNTVLTCDCTGHGYTSIDLNEMVSNQNGQLACDN